MFKRLIASLVCFTFSFSNFQYAHAQDFSINQLPVPGTMVGVSAPFAPLALKGLIVNPQKPLEFQFIVDTGSDVSLRGAQATKQSQQEQLKQQANQLVKYFLAGLTIPEGDLWVNLSPYEKNRMVPEALGQTDLGRDLLAQDYILKQLTASLIYPEKDLGKEFWSRVYAKAQKQFGTTNVPVNTFNKVWILPDQAQVFENGNAAYVTKATLKVMLDEDYLALSKHQGQPGAPTRGHVQDRTTKNVSPSTLPTNEGLQLKAPQGNNQPTSNLASQIVRQIILPEIEKEVNTGKNFAPLRQIYQTLILAKWYKETIQNGLLDAVYTNKNKVAGVNLNDPSVKEQIYNRYLQAYKKGAFNYIKEDPMPDGQVVPRKYFSGGISKLEPTHVDTNGAMSAITSDGAILALKVDLEKSDAAMDTNQGELPKIAALPDLDAIELYRQLLAEGMGNIEKEREFLRVRQQRLLKRLTAIAGDIVAPSQRLYDSLRSSLLSEFSDEMSTHDFIEQHLMPMITKAENSDKKRLLFGFSGTFASGKTTVADFVRDELIRKKIPWVVKTISFDDFLREKEDRKPVNTENPLEKFDVERFKNFMQLLSDNQRVTKPIYDQTSKGQLKFGLDEDGKLTIFSGSQELVIDFQRDSVIFEKFSVDRDKNGRRGGRTKNLEKGSFEVIGKKSILLGSLPVTLERSNEGSGLTIYIKDSRFDIVNLENKLILNVEGENPVELTKENKAEALEVWNPVSSSDPKTREIIVVEGILILSAVELFDLSADVNVSSTVRQVRSNIREETRGRKGMDIQTQHSEALTVREVTEDTVINNLDVEAIKTRGFGSPAPVQTHFQISNMTLPEQIFRNYFYGRITQRHKRIFTPEGLDLDGIINGMKEAEQTAIKDWLREVIGKTKKFFTTPGAFPGEKALSSEEEFERYWKGGFRTLALGRYLLLKFQISKQGRFGDLDPETEADLRMLLNRTQGLVVGSRILDLNKDDISIQFLEKSKKDPIGKEKEVALKKVLLMNQLRFMEGVLNQVEEKYKAVQNGTEAQRHLLAEGQHWIDDFFRVQFELARLGIVDTAPSLTRRYGLGFYHAKEVVLGVAPSSYRIDNEALAAVDKITRKENTSRKNGFMKTRIEKYKDLKGIKQLEGFQLRFLGNSETKEDYLATIPKMLRQYYIDKVRKFPKNKDGLTSVTSGFGQEWIRAGQEMRARTLKNEGVASIPMNYRRIESVSGVIGEHALKKLQKDFMDIMQKRTLKDKEGTTPQLQWVVSYEASLQEDPYNFLYSMADTFKNALLDNPDWLLGKTFDDVEQINGEVLTKLTQQRKGNLPIQSTWQQDVFKKVIEFALKFPTWEEFDKNVGLETSVGPRSDQAMSQPQVHQDKASIANGGIDLNQIKVNRTGKIVNVQFDPAQLNALEQGGFEGFTPVITGITHISSPFQLLGIAPTKIPHSVPGSSL